MIKRDYNCAKSLQDRNTFAQHLRGVSETKACGQRHKSTVVTDREMLYQAAVVRGKEGLWWDMEGVRARYPLCACAVHVLGLFHGVNQRCKEECSSGVGARPAPTLEPQSAASEEILSHTYCRVLQTRWIFHVISPAQSMTTHMEIHMQRLAEARMDQLGQEMDALRLRYEKIIKQRDEEIDDLSEKLRLHDQKQHTLCDRLDEEVRRHQLEKTNLEQAIDAMQRKVPPGPPLVVCWAAVQATICRSWGLRMLCA